MDTTSLPINYANNQTKPDETSLLDIILWSQMVGVCETVRKVAKDLEK